MVLIITSSKSFGKYTQIYSFYCNYSLMSTKCQVVKLEVSNFKNLYFQVHFVASSSRFADLFVRIPPNVSIWLTFGRNSF